jgi:GT2 family glycosyltransferase
MNKVHIVILNWNGLKDTLECLRSVYRLDYPFFSVIVVDNGSSDNSISTIHQIFPQVILIENSNNLGFTGGTNLGIHRALELGTDYVWLLNNDTVVEPDTLNKLVDASEKDPQIGLATPALYHYDKPNKFQFIGAYSSFSEFNISLVREPSELEIKVVQQNLILWGTALLVKKSVIEKIGYLSEKYFAYYEDCDYCLRALRAGYKNLVILDTRVLHKGSQTTSKRSSFQVYLRTRNTYFLWKDNLPCLRRILLPGYYIGMVIYNAKIFSDEGNERCFDACLNGFWAAVRGSEGGYDPTIVVPSYLKAIFKYFINYHPGFWIDFFKCNVVGVLRRLLPGGRTYSDIE